MVRSKTVSKSQSLKRSKRKKTLELEVPARTRTTLPNGLQVMVAERGPLPLVALRLVVRAGSAYDPANRLGLADFTGRMLRRGTRSLPSDALNEAIEQLGASLALTLSGDFIALTLTTPTEHLGPMLDLLAEMVREPALAPEEIASAKRRVVGQLANRLSEPGWVADTALHRAVFGDHPYGHDASGRVSHLERLTREDVTVFHREKYVPSRAVLVIVGAVSADQVLERAGNAFSSWSGSGSDSALPAVGALAMAGKIVVVHRADQSQTQVRIGSLGFGRASPDFFPAAMMNATLGGAFTSRLMTEIRVKRGLSYGASSSFTSWLAGGHFAISTFTKTESTREVLDVAFEQVKRMRSKGPTPRELDSARSLIRALYPARVETNELLAGVFGDMVIYDLPDDWVEMFRDRIAAVSLPEAKAAARRLLFDDQRTIALVGDAEAIIKQVGDLGEVVQIEATELN